MSAEAPAATPIDVLVVNYLTPDLAARAVAAVSGPGVTVHLWDNSGDFTPVAGVRLRGDGTNHFFAAANNRLFEDGVAPLVLLLNPDVELDHASLQTMVRALEAATGAWGVTPRLIGPDGLDQNYLHALPTARGLLADRLPPLRRVFSRAFADYRALSVDLAVSAEVEQPPAAALLLRRRDLESVGGLFDEAYPLFFNDVDLGRRMRPLGTCRYAADVTAAHVGGASLKAGRRSVGIERLYNDGLLHYARVNLPTAYPVIRIAVALRRVADRLHGGWWR